MKAIVITIFTILFILFLIGRVHKTNGWKIWEIIICVLSAGLFSGMLSGIILIFGQCGLEQEERLTASYNLVALDTKENIQGSYSNLFFVGSGYIGEELYYHFYYETINGIKYEKLAAKNCYIIETKEKPSYKKYGMYYKDKESIFYHSNEQSEGKQVLYIPKGTIKTSYKVN